MSEPFKAEQIFVPVTKRVPHVREEEHGRKRTSLPRGSECAAGFLAGRGGQNQERSRRFQSLTWKKFDLKV